ncbi:MAG: chemotaxis protein CheR, partial [Acidobacteria bacterium]|nr:chemotaxis protein CheR [Acidobacteriota bacterium]NIM60844.1 chemotaxis protein CheR [Acidobacteriota bacterium]NIO58692.1 chemotaxis protein CheR [Acidobacteriota bacterium]NIQ29748.1 chemotaxis protein CheR [Acidobacteriota bacterium]NIQ87032.1 chemotaxis protein CheR [Acidobacteriota bacterium]
VLCRNLVFTYYDEALQRLLLAQLARRLVPGGALVIGIHESLPAQQASMFAGSASLGIYVRETATAGKT